MKEVIPSSRIPCFSCDCDIYKKEQENQNKGDYSCCIWYMEHVVLNNESTHKCPTYSLIMKNKRRKDNAG